MTDDSIFESNQVSSTNNARDLLSRFGSLLDKFDEVMDDDEAGESGDSKPKEVDRVRQEYESKLRLSEQKANKALDGFVNIKQWVDEEIECMKELFNEEQVALKTHTMIKLLHAIMTASGVKKDAEEKAKKAAMDKTLEAVRSGSDDSSAVAAEAIKSKQAALKDALEQANNSVSRRKAELEAKWQTEHIKKHDKLQAEVNSVFTRAEANYGLSAAELGKH